MPLGVPTGIFGPATFVGGIAVGTGVGSAVAGAIEPLILDIRHGNLAKFPVVPMLAVEAASLVASGERSMGWGKGEAANQGINGDRFEALVDMLDTAPDLALLYRLVWRGLIGEGDFREGAKKGTIEDKWLNALWDARVTRLSPAEAANAWQQGFMDEADAEQEAARAGVPPTLAQIQRELAGLPPGAMDGLTLLRRGLVNEDTYRQIVREGHTKTKYTDALLGLREHIIPGREAAGLWLRGWLTEAEAKARGALDGWGPDEMELLYQNRGRPATPRQMWLAIRRSDATEDDFRTAIKQSNIRTEYTDWLWATRFTYPSLFQLNRLVTSGAFTIERGRQILSHQGWELQDIEAMVAWWGEQGEAPEAKWVGRARSRLFTVAHNEYLDESIDEAQALAVLAQVGATPIERPQIIALWNAERGIARLELTPSQIKKAYKKGPPDGYTFEEAMALLDVRGYTPDDAETLLTT